MVCATQQEMGLRLVTNKNLIIARPWAGALLAVLFMTIQVCAPPASVGEEEARALTAEERKRRERDCLISLSNAWEYYKNQEFESSIRNYRRLVDLDCGEEYADEVYVYFGRAFLETGHMDSAVWAFKQGLRYLPENKNLLENIAYTLGRLQEVDEEIYYYQRYIEVDPANAEVFATLTDLLRQEGRHDDLLLTLHLWDEMDPANSAIQSDLIAAYEAAGKDPLTYLRQRWEDNPGNAQWGIDYATKLIDGLDYAAAYRVLEGVIQRTPTARAAYKFLAETALDEADVDRAISAYERLYAVNPTDDEAAMELARAYLRKSAYSRALEWAEQALKGTTSEGEVLYVRAEVYFATADDCVSGREGGAANFQDKLVYLMAFEDYAAAVDKGYRRARTRAEFLEKNFVPSKGDWFLQQADIRVFKPQGNCYGWITRTVRRP